MVPATEEVVDDVIIIAGFRCEDLVRLHSLLVAYESPYRTAGEVAERTADVRAHERLRQQIASLVVEATSYGVELRRSR